MSIMVLYLRNDVEVQITYLKVLFENLRLNLCNQNFVLPAFFVRFKNFCATTSSEKCYNNGIGVHITLFLQCGQFEF